MPGPKLRLTLAPRASAIGVAEDADAPPRTLKFPGAVRDVVGAPDPRKARVFSDPAADATEALERMQRGMDALHRAFDADWDGPAAA